MLHIFFLASSSSLQRYVLQVTSNCLNNIKHQASRQELPSEIGDNASIKPRHAFLVVYLLGYTKGYVVVKRRQVVAVTMRMHAFKE